jgi:hypothetical protein
MENKINYSVLIPFDVKNKGEQKFQKLQKELYDLGIKWNSHNEDVPFLLVNEETYKIKALIIKSTQNRDVLFYSTTINPEKDDSEKYLMILPHKIKEGYDKLNKLRLVEKL